MAALVSAANPADMTLIVHPLNMVAFDKNIIYAGGTTSAFVAPVANPRIDLLVYSTTSSDIAVRAGTEAGSPTAPTPSTGDVVLCSIYHRVGETTIEERDDSTNGYIKSWYVPSIYQGAWLPGDIKVSSAYTVASGWLRCDGSAVSRATYSALFSSLAPTIGTCTISIASPGVVTKASHGLNIGDAIYFSTTGTLPTGLSPNTIYYIISAGFGANSFQVSATRGGAAINTTNTHSGVHTLFYCPFGLGDGSTTFNVPNFKGKVLAGYDTTQTEFANLGYAYGEKTHVLTVAELAAHTHPPLAPNTSFTGTSNGGPTLTSSSGYGNVATTGSTGSDTGHNTIQPTLSINYLIKT
jgi:microcystin-dependent protein